MPLIRSVVGNNMTAQQDGQPSYFTRVIKILQYRTQFGFFLMTKWDIFFNGELQKKNTNS